VWRRTFSSSTSGSSLYTCGTGNLGTHRAYSCSTGAAGGAREHTIVKCFSHASALSMAQVVLKSFLMLSVPSLRFFDAELTCDHARPADDHDCHPIAPNRRPVLPQHIRLHITI
jgi:hypothetical protein